jgi:hypothetical protein
MAIIDRIHRLQLTSSSIELPRIHRPLLPVTVQINIAALFCDNLATLYASRSSHAILNSHQQPLILPQTHLLINTSKMQNHPQLTFCSGQAVAAQILYDGKHHLVVFTGTGMSIVRYAHLFISHTPIREWKNSTTSSHGALV